MVRTGADRVLCDLKGVVAQGRTSASRKAELAVIARDARCVWLQGRNVLRQSGPCQNP